MMYVALVHKDSDSAYGVTIPDAPGCFSAGDTLEEAIANASEALRLWCEFEELPPPRDLDSIVADPELAEALEAALLVLVTVPQPPRAMERIAVTAAFELAPALDRVAARTGLSWDAQVDRAIRAALAQEPEKA